MVILLIIYNLPVFKNFHSLRHDTALINDSIQGSNMTWWGCCHWWNGGGAWSCGIDHWNWSTDGSTGEKCAASVLRCWKMAWHLTSWWWELAHVGFLCSFLGRCNNGGKLRTCGEVADACFHSIVGCVTTIINATCTDSQTKLGTGIKVDWRLRFFGRMRRVFWIVFS